MSRSHLGPARARAFASQEGLCCYCRTPMWLGEDTRVAFVKEHGLSGRQARSFQATAEHLLAHQNGGRGGANIAASCLLCNGRRHHRRPEFVLDPEAYAAYVQQRVARGKWFPFALPLSLCVAHAASGASMPSCSPETPPMGLWRRLCSWVRRRWPGMGAEATSLPTA